MALSSNGRILRMEQKINRNGNDGLNINGIELGWKSLLMNEAKEIRNGMIQQIKNGNDLGWKSFWNEAKKKNRKGND